MSDAEVATLQSIYGRDHLSVVAHVSDGMLAEIAPYGTPEALLVRNGRILRRAVGQDAARLILK
jgi:hypothetical protein